MDEFTFIRKFDVLLPRDEDTVNFLANLQDGEIITLYYEAKQRTGRQNNAMHRWFRLLAAELNARGLDMRKVLKPGVEIPWSGETVKQYIWRPVQKALIGSDSTRDLTTAQVSEVYDAINRHLGSTRGVHVPFPENRYGQHGY